MSVIHEALKRAERERSTGSVPRTADATPALMSPPQSFRHRMIIATTVLILILGVVLWTRHRINQPATPATSAMRPSGSPTTPKAPGVGIAPAALPAGTTLPAAGAADLDPARLNAEAVTSFKDGRHEEAGHLLAQALRLAPAMPEAHNNMGMVLQAQGRRKEAKEEYLRALDLLPGYPEALNNLGLVACEEGNQAEAIGSFEKALEKKPSYSSAHLNLAVILDKQGKIPDAFSHYRRFLDNAGPDEESLVRRVKERLRR